MKVPRVVTVLLVLSLLLETALSQVEKRWWRRQRRRCHPKNCEVSKWCQWSGCSRTCGGHGRQMRTRHVTRNQKCGGRCNYSLHETKPCDRVCFNGGIWTSNGCYCQSGYSGECCQLTYNTLAGKYALKYMQSIVSGQFSICKIRISYIGCTLMDWLHGLLLTH